MRFGVISPCTILPSPFQKRSSSFLHFGQVENILEHLIEKNLDLFWKRKKIEELEYLFHYVKFKMSPALLILCKFPTFRMLVLACTLFPPIYREIENWYFECCSRLVFPIFPMMKEVKNWSFLDKAGKR